MAYRERPRPAPEDDELVVVRNFFDSVEAGLAKAMLESEGIRTWVLESASFNPMLNVSAGGVAVQVRSSDEERARALLDHVERTRVSLEDDDEPAGTVRCPRCELAYCSFERARFSDLANGSVTLFGYLESRAERKRWRCHKCLHVWDDASEGPLRPTPLAEDAPHPVFRLRRAAVGAGFAIGAVLGVIGLVMLDRLGGLALMALGSLCGALVGRSFGSDVCSEPSCRSPLERGRETCPKCQGVIAGRIERASDHFAASGDARRALALDAAKNPPRLPAKRKSSKAATARAKKKRSTSDDAAS